MHSYLKRCLWLKYKVLVDTESVALQDKSLFLVSIFSSTSLPRERLFSAEIFDFWRILFHFPASGHVGWVERRPPRAVRPCSHVTSTCQSQKPLVPSATRLVFVRVYFKLAFLSLLEEKLQGLSFKPPQLIFYFASLKECNGNVTKVWNGG